MSGRWILALAIGATLGIGVAVALVVSLGAESSASGSGRYRGSEVPSGIELSDFSLRSHDRRVVRSSDVRGRVTALTFLDSQCTESCPVIAWTVARALDALTREERSDVWAVAISTDPSEDTRRNVRRFLRRNRAVGRFLYVGGGQAASELRSVWSAFNVLSSLDSGQDTLHSAPVRIYDRRGIWVSTLHAGADLTVANLVHDMRIALAAG